MLLYFSGWPACGAAFYGEWFARRFDFHHVDLDNNAGDDGDVRGLTKKLDATRGAALAQRLYKKYPRWVVTERAPTDDLDRLDALMSVGFSLWFLLARSESLSRQRWLMLEREVDPEVRPAAWEREADAIRSNARRLRPYFRDRCIETLNTGLVLMDGDELAARVGVLVTK
jgi:hypothetical protein